MITARRSVSVFGTVAALLLSLSSANAATDDGKKNCLQYDKQSVTLTGTVLVRKSPARTLMTRHPRVMFRFPCWYLTNEFAHGDRMTNPKVSYGHYKSGTPAHAHGQHHRV
jgi:hypothetical protein